MSFVNIEDITILVMEQFQGIARTQFPTNINYASEFPTFGEIAEVNPARVQWKGLALGEPPSWSWLTPMPGKYAYYNIIGTLS